MGLFTRVCGLGKIERDQADTLVSVQLGFGKLCQEGAVFRLHGHFLASPHCFNLRDESVLAKYHSGRGVLSPEVMVREELK
jgi:hypothetical protein